MAHLPEANLCGTKFTPEGRPKGVASFLDLGTCFGLEKAGFSEPDFLPNYLARAFEYAHIPDIPERKWPAFIGSIIVNIRALSALFADQAPPKQLIDVVSVITAELVQYLGKHPDALYYIKPRQFEELIAEILASYNWQVQLTPPTKDGGYDIFAISKTIEPGLASSWIIECKKYAPENKVGVDIVRALYGVKSNMKVANALLATTSYFTKGAKDFKASRYDIDLRDYESILEWINHYRPNPTGRLYIKDNKLILPNES
jgi:HJR/Mrr/RecB family endonuclease